MLDSGPCDWLVFPLLLLTPTISFSVDYKRWSCDGVVNGIGRNGHVLFFVLFFRLRFCRAYHFAYDSDFRFSLGRKLSYDFDWDSVASENQP